MCVVVGSRDRLLISINNIKSRTKQLLIICCFVLYLLTTFLSLSSSKLQKMDKGEFESQLDLPVIVTGIY